MLFTILCNADVLLALPQSLYIISIPAVQVTSRPAKHQEVFFHPVTLVYEANTSALTCKVSASVSYFKTLSKKLENALEQHVERILIQTRCALSPRTPNWVEIRIHHHGEDKCLLCFIQVFDAPQSFVVVFGTLFLWSACLKRCLSALFL
ncbi:hypothetical protein QQF64_010817 [Cirrhinus molitorella]|uniref:Uncharacterized protein n=1 Tax=Cirrhinus molitorella TaxID=172907 RepID=A0ABR3LXG8_9TELE